MDKTETMTLKMDKNRKLTLINEDSETQITFIQAARMFGSNNLMKLTQAIGPAQCDTATIEVQPKSKEGGYTDVFPENQ